MVATGTFLLDAAVIVIAARAGALALERVRQPGVIGEIIAGVALGPTLLGALPGDPSAALFPPGAQDDLKLVGQLGLVLLVFTVGWDLDLQVVRRRTGAATSISLVSIAVPFALGLALATYLHPGHDTVAGVSVPFWPFALFVSAALSLTAFPVLARILEDMRLAGTELGTLALTAAAVNDALGWGALAAALAALASDGPLTYLRIAAELVVFTAAVLLVVRPLLRRALPSAWGEALAVAAALFGGYLTDAIGIHAVFGAFLVGVAMPRPHDDIVLAGLRRRLSPAVALLGSIYFVTSGMAVDIPGLQARDAGAFVLIVAAACAGKFLGAFAGARAARTPPRDAALIGVLMNTRGLIEIVLLTVGRDAGLIDGRLFTLLVLMAILTTLSTSPLVAAIRRHHVPASV
jgi:K+:H+ antiporter